MTTMGRGVRRVLWGLWGVCLVIAVAFAGYVGWILVSGIPDLAEGDAFRTESEIDCSVAMKYAHGTLPAHASDQDCTFTDWQDDHAGGEFRMPRAEARPWLAEAYPGVEVSTSCGAPDRDLCLSASFEDTSGGTAAGVRIDVTYEDGDTALVRLSAHSM